MPPLTAVERFFEQFLERPSARLFRARLQPVQLQRRIERAMESERLTTSDRTLVPNQFVVHLNPDDLAGFGDMTTTLASELADAALAFAKAHRYTVGGPAAGRSRRRRPRSDRTDIRVDARFADAIGRSDRPRRRPPIPKMSRSSSATPHDASSRFPDADGPRARLADHGS